MKRYNLNLNLFRSDPLENKGLAEPVGGSEMIPGDLGHPVVNSVVESVKDQATSRREEEVERWMNNIKEFIRAIDVKNL